MDRTLYLNESDRVKLVVDGPSLWVTPKGKAGRRIPARLIGRVVIFGNVRVGIDMIVLFAARGIPVSFYSRKGEPLATALPRMPVPGVNADRLRDAMETAGGMERLADWMKSRRTAFMLEWLREAGHPMAAAIESSGLDEASYERAAARRFGDAARYAETAGLLRGMVEETALNVIVKAGLDAHIGIRQNGRDFGLCADFGWIMRGEIDRMACVIAGEGASGRKLLIAAARVFEAGRREIRTRLRALTGEMLNVARNAA
jgi:CRISPR/Cas system-associated endonuclease Cas1